jgi:hypothetical protein
MNKYDKELEAARSAAGSAAESAELEYQINKVLEVLED